MAELVRTYLAANSRAVERILGAPDESPDESIVTFDTEMLRAWFGPRGASEEGNAPDDGQP